MLGCTRMPEGFHARFSALSRRYEYRVLRTRAPSPLRAARTWHWPREVSQELLAGCADALLGEHDFRAFTPAETQHEVFRRSVLAAALGAARRRARVPHRGRLVPAPHGAHAGRHDAPDRGGERPPEALREPARRARRAPRPASRRRRTRSAWCRTYACRTLATTTTQTERGAFYHPDVPEGGGPATVRNAAAGKVRHP